MKDYDVYFYKGFKEDEDFWKKCFEKENSCIETAEKNNENEKLKKQIDGAIEWLKNLRWKNDYKINRKQKMGCVGWLEQHSTK